MRCRRADGSTGTTRRSGPVSARTSTQLASDSYAQAWAGTATGQAEELAEAWAEFVKRLWETVPAPLRAALLAMSGQPDPKPERAEKRSRRSRDPLKVKNATLADRECWGCGREGANGHHLVPKDYTKPGPDADWNTISLCGTGTAGCHGAYHGNPYTSTSGERITPTIVKARIAARLVHDPRRLRATIDFLDTSMLREQFFRRHLGMSARDLDDLLRRYA